jgi:hypothetical protein
MHTYKPPALGRADSTMIVFPSFMPRLHEDDIPARCTVPNNISTLVQHLGAAVDLPPFLSLLGGGAGRGAVLFKQPGANVKKEVWIFTHFALKVDPGRIGLYDDRVFDATDDLMDELLNLTAARLNSPSIELTFVDGDEDFKNLFGAFKAFMGMDDDHVNRNPTRADVERAIKSLLGQHAGVEDFGKLRFMTWDEYAATLTPEQKALQTIPDHVRLSMCTWANSIVY